MIKIVDYGLGNIAAFVNLYARLNISAEPAQTSGELECAEKIILPGVGSFDHAMKLLDASGMRETLERMTLIRKVPVLGVCVGMQMLAGGSDEGTSRGLGWVPGYVRAFRSVHNAISLPLPHMGWNDVAPNATARLFKGLEREARFYFLHSYFFECAQHDSVEAETDYGINFSCAVRHENIYGVQFHPEKSHRYGMALLRNFAEL